MDSFAFVIIDDANIVSTYKSVPFQTKYHHFKNVDPVEILAIIQGNNLRSNRFEKVNISLDHEAFTYVPANAYDPTSWLDYLAFVSSGVKKDDVAASRKRDDMVCVYTFPLPIRKLFSTLYPTSQVSHLTESLIGFLQAEVGQDPTIFVLMHGEDAYVIIFEDHSMTLINRYHAPTAKDRLYYILLACKHRRLNPRKVNIKISGDQDDSHELQEELRKFFIHVTAIEWRNGWRLPLSVKDPLELFEFYCMHHADHRRTV